MRQLLRCKAGFPRVEGDGRMRLGYIRPRSDIDAPFVNAPIDIHFVSIDVRPVPTDIRCVLIDIRAPSWCYELSQEG